MTAGAGSTTGVDEECPPAVVSWEGTADIQSGDILIVRITDALLQSMKVSDVKNKTLEVNVSNGDGAR